jgi:hypothetical protein
MSDRKGFDLGDYIEVKDRIKLFYELYGQGRLVTDDVVILTAPDDKQRVMVKALAYRTPDDPHPAVGYSWMELPGTTSYTRGSELENTETSAWGRAIAALGILLDKSIASAQEVQNKQGYDRKDSGMVYDEPLPPTHHDGGLIGTAEVGKSRNSDWEVRKSEDDDHFVLGFRLANGRKAYNVRARDELALQLADMKDSIVGQRVTVWGSVADQTDTVKGRDITYQIVHAERMQTPKGKLPVSPLRDPEQEAVDAIPVAEGQEALFDPAESARIDAEEAKASA